MHLRTFTAVLAATTLAACAAPTRIVPPAGALTAELNDWLDSDSDADDPSPRIFAVLAIDGVEVMNGARNVRRVGFGAGAGQLPYLVARPIEVKPMKVTVTGTHLAASPIAELARRAKGTFQQIDGILDFTPVPNTVYRVAGKLAAAQSEIWIEEWQTRKVVTQTLRSKPSP